MNCKEINVYRKNFIEIPYGAREGSPESGGVQPGRQCRQVP